MLLKILGRFFIYIFRLAKTIMALISEKIGGSLKTNYKRLVSESVALKLCEAVVLFGQFPALSGADLEVKQGEIIALTGTNGAGKTTLLRLLAGLVRLSQGSGEVVGVDLKANNLSELHKRVGLVGNHTMLYEDLTVLENLKFWGGIQNLDGESADTLTYLELPQDFWNLPVRKLSTGQKKRSALALQILRRPSLWLLDEPHAGLDKSGRNILNEVIYDASQKGATVLFTTHEGETKSLATRELELKGGRFA